MKENPLLSIIKSETVLVKISVSSLSSLRQASNPYPRAPRQGQPRCAGTVGLRAAHLRLLGRRPGCLHNASARTPVEKHVGSPGVTKFSFRWCSLALRSSRHGGTGFVVARSLSLFFFFSQVLNFLIDLFDFLRESEGASAAPSRRSLPQMPLLLSGPAGAAAAAGGDLPPQRMLLGLRWYRRAGPSPPARPPPPAPAHPTRAADAIYSERDLSREVSRKTTKRGGKQINK